MKCRHCNSEWNTSTSISASIQTCPFCGVLLAERTKVDTAEGVVATIYRDYGETELRNGKHLLAFFSDLAPGLKKEKLILSHFIACGGHTILLDAKRQNADPKLYIERIVYKMTDELLLSELLSRQICEKYWVGIGGNLLPSHADLPEESALHPVRDMQTKKPVSPVNLNKLNKPTLAPLNLNTADFKIKGRTLVKYLGSSPNPCVPDGIRIIDKNAFKDNKVIQSVTLPDSVIKIKEDAFNFCRNLHTINLPPRLETIGEGAFSYSGLRSVNLPDNLTFLGERAFYDTKISKVRIPSTITTVPAETFMFCRELREVELCSGVESLVANAFAYCANLKTIIMPDSLVRIDAHWSAYSPFCGTDNITSVIASDRWKKDNPEILRILIPSPNESENFVVEGDVLIRYYGRAIRPAIPTGVAKIGKGAFANNSHIQSIVVPEGVHTIAERAFSGCRNLRMVTLPKSLMRIGEYAFCYTGLVSLVIPTNVYGVGGRAFESCDRLKELTIPDGLTNLPATAFEWCRNIETIHASNTWKSRNAALVSAIMKNRSK